MPFLSFSTKNRLEQNRILNYSSIDTTFYSSIPISLYVTINQNPDFCSCSFWMNNLFLKSCGRVLPYQGDMEYGCISVQLVPNRRSMALELKLSCWNNRFVIRGDGVTLHQSVFCFRACFATQVMYEYNNCKHPATVENFPGLFLHILVLRKTAKLGFWYYLLGWKSVFAIYLKK